MDPSTALLLEKSVFAGFFSSSISRNNVIFDSIYDVCKIAIKTATNQISPKDALEALKDKGVISTCSFGGALVGYTAGTAITGSLYGGALLTSISNCWNPLGWIVGTLFVACTIFGGIKIGYKTGEKILDYIKNFNLFNAFKVFDIAYTTDKKKIVQRYYLLARKNHPDNGGKKEEFQKINNAYGIILAHIAILEKINILEKNKFEKFFVEMLSLLTWSVTAGLTLINAGITIGSGTYSVYKLIKNE